MVILIMMVMMMSRSQPGESPASYVVQGLMDFLVSKHKIAQELREKLIFKVSMVYHRKNIQEGRRGIYTPRLGYSYDES